MGYILEKKIKVIILIAIIAGTGVFIGVTVGIMAQQGAMDQILLLLGITLPKKTTYIAPTSNHPEDVATDLGGTETINWTLYDDVGPGQYRVWVNDTNDNYYLRVNWTPWINDTNLAISINRTYMNVGIVFNYTIEFYDNNSRFGTPDTVMVTQKMWTWVSGNNTINEQGTYGTQGVPAAENVPGARYMSVSWRDSDDNLWLFGGYGRDSAGSEGRLNDLWMYNTTSGWWMWVSGNNTINQAGTYGTQGVPALGNFPGARQECFSWTDSNDNLWLFGGWTPIGWGWLNELWMYNMTSGWWTWVSGNNTINQNGTYGTKSVPAAGNIPGSRDGGVSWRDSNDNLWLFGGFAFDSVGDQGRVNDLWMFNITSGWWTWVWGSNIINQGGIYGSQGVPAASNEPGARFDCISWTDSNDNLWLFGGFGRDSTGFYWRLNDLWMYNITSGWWTWVSGSNIGQQWGNYGSRGMPASTNVPGARDYSVTWKDTDDNLWLFGGWGHDSGGLLNKLNDLWMFNMTSGYWTWISGSNRINQAGTYGTKGVPAATNVPEARRILVSWTDSDDNLWLFGGGGLLNDLWKYGK